MKLSALRIVTACSLTFAATSGADVTPGVTATALRPAPRVDDDRRGDPRDVHQCRLNALHPADNDIRLDGRRRAGDRPAPLPTPVARAILDHVSDIAKKQFTVPEWREPRQTCAEIFAPVLRLDGPEGLEVYVAPRSFLLGNSVDYFFVYDASSGAVTRSPPLIYTKWSKAFEAADRLIAPPIVRTAPGMEGRPPLLVVEERTHNGNVYDAAVYHYFELRTDMSLTQILAVEARAMLLSDPDEYTERKATWLSANRIRLDVSSRSRRAIGARGSVTLERAQAGQPFHVAARDPAPGTRPDALVTYCESAKSDDAFLRLGCDFYY